jgi:hypothetical protein
MTTFFYSRRFPIIHFMQPTTPVYLPSPLRYIYEGAFSLMFPVDGFSTWYSGSAFFLLAIAYTERWDPGRTV